MSLKNVEGKFIYVFDAHAKKQLSDAGFIIIKSDEKNSIYCFHNKFDEFGVLDTVSFITSNKLTF